MKFNRRSFLHLGAGTGIATGLSLSKVSAAASNMPSQGVKRRNSNQRLVDCWLGSVGIDAEAATSAGLWIHVDQQDTLFLFSDTGSQVYRCCCLADATFLAGDRDDSPHLRSLRGRGSPGSQGPPAEGRERRGRRWAYWPAERVVSRGQNVNDYCVETLGAIWVCFVTIYK